MEIRDVTEVRKHAEAEVEARDTGDLEIGRAAACETDRECPVDTLGIAFERETRRGAAAVEVACEDSGSGAEMELADGRVEAIDRTARIRLHSQCHRRGAAMHPTRIDARGSSAAPVLS